MTASHTRSPSLDRGSAASAASAAPSDDVIAAAWLADSVAGLRQLKTLAERAVAQVDDRALAVALDDEANSIAVLVRHLTGNLRSRWTDFLDTDGEKPDRRRDEEFEPSDADGDRARLLAEWDAAWAVCFASIEALRPADLLRTIHIRGEPATAIEAIGRSTRHVAQHVGQIVLLAKHLAGDRWATLTLPRRR